MKMFVLHYYEYSYNDLTISNESLQPNKTLQTNWGKSCTASMCASTKTGVLQVYFYKLHLKLNFRTQLSGYLCTISFVQILGICYLPHQYKNMCVRSQRWRKTLFVSLWVHWELQPHCGFVFLLVYAHANEVWLLLRVILQACIPVIITGWWTPHDSQKTNRKRLYAIWENKLLVVIKVPQCSLFFGHNFRKDNLLY